MKKIRCKSGNSILKVTQPAKADTSKIPAMGGTTSSPAKPTGGQMLLLLGNEVSEVGLRAGKECSRMLAFRRHSRTERERERLEFQEDNIG